MNVFVTGGTGFIGRHLVQALLGGGHRVYALARKPGLVCDGAIPVLGDLLDDRLPGLLPEGLDLLYHLAAFSSVGASIEKPAECMKVNLLGTQNLLEAAKRREVRKFALVSSVYVYGDVRRFPTAEDVCPMPMNPLGASKAAAEYLARAYSVCWDLPVVTFRPFTVYGPGSGPHQFIPSLIAKLLQDQPLEMGDPCATRDFTHVEDVVRGLLSILDHPSARGVFNLGTSVETPVQQLVDLLLELTGQKGKHVSFRRLPARADERGGVSRQCADISRAADELGWRPRVSLRDGLTDLIRRVQETGRSGSAEVVNRHVR